MKYENRVKMTYVKDGETIEQEYSSLYQCAVKNQIAPITLRNYVAGKMVSSDKLGLLPPDARIDVSEPLYKTHPELMPNKNVQYHCDICDQDMKLTSKQTHMLSIKHRETQLGIRKKHNVSK